MAKREILQGADVQPSQMTVGEWLRAGARFFPSELLAPLREKAAEQLRAQRARIDAELRELDAPEVPPDTAATTPLPRLPIVRSTNGTASPLRDTRGPGADATIPEIVKYVLGRHPDSPSGAIIAQVKRVKPDADEAGIHSVLYRLTKDEDGPVIKSGERGSLTYRLREVTN